MIRKESLSFTAQSAGRVDKVSSDFSYPSCTIYVNDRVVKKSFRVSAGDIVTVTWSEEVFEGLEGEDIPLDILYEDDSVLVINKPCGMVVHPGAGNWSGTLVNALLYRYGEDFATSEDEEVNLMRPGIVHRLDKDTSGVMVCHGDRKDGRCPQEPCRTVCLPYHREDIHRHCKRVFREEKGNGGQEHREKPL